MVVVKPIESLIETLLLSTIMFNANYTEDRLGPISSRS